MMFLPVTFGGRCSSSTPSVFTKEYEDMFLSRLGKEESQLSKGNSDGCRWIDRSTNNRRRFTHSVNTESNEIRLNFNGAVFV